MVITFRPETYGPGPDHEMIFGTTGSASLEPILINVEGGGWGLRDHRNFTDVNAPNAYEPVAGALNNPASAFYETYKLASLTIPSNSHNGYDFLQHVTWTHNQSYDHADLVVHNGGYYRCIEPHTSSTGVIEPGVAGPSDDYWATIDSADISTPRVPGRGESTPGYGFSQAVAVQRAIGYIRANYARLGVDPTKIILKGESAGGNNGGLAAFSEQMDWSGVESPQMAHPYNAIGDTTPNALILEQTPAPLDLYLNAAEGSGVQNFLLSVWESLFGRDGLNTFAGWDAFDINIKKSLDVLRALERNGISMPVYLDYALGRKRYDTQTVDSNPANDIPIVDENLIYNGDGAQSIVPDVHHPLNGWKIFEKLTKPVEDGGHGRTDCVFFQSSGTDEEYETYTEWKETPVEGVDFSTATILDANYDQTHGEAIVTWMNSVI